MNLLLIILQALNELYNIPRDPEFVVQNCLKLFRQCDFKAVAEYIPLEIFENQPPIQSNSLPVADIRADDADVNDDSNSRRIKEYILSQDLILSRFAHVLDVPSRRLLPCHLLRRSQVLGSFSVNKNSLVQRIALTARNGEESIFEWRLMKRDSGPEVINSVRNPEGWVIKSVKYQGSTDTQLPSTPHPRHPPERVIEAQLAALADNDIYNASLFNAWKAGHANTGMLVQYDLLRRKLDASIAPLQNVNLQTACLGASALVSEKKQLQEVRLAAHDADMISQYFIPMRSLSFVWTLELAPNGCWMCTNIEEGNNALQ